MIKILFVGTVENRLYNNDNDNDYIDMPPLINCIDGTICIKENELSDLEKYKNYLINFIKNISDTNNFYYNTIDPIYTNNIKNKNKENKNYLGHIPCLLYDIPEKFNKSFDYIFITNCYQGFFNENNINKLNLLSKYNNKIYIFNEVPYIINDYMKNNLLYEFISPIIK